MSILTVDHETTIQEKIFNILPFYLWDECKAEVKSLYQAAKQTLTEEDQEELLLSIYIDSLPDDDYSTYWNYMNA
jgi:hypothetical protein